MEVPDLRPGQRLINHAIIVAVRKVTEREGVVLAIRPGVNDPYVTWRIDLESGECFWGHYFINYDKASGDFIRRSAE